MTTEEAVKKIQAELLSLADEKYRSFHSGLIPNVDSERIIGIRTPVLKKYAAEIKDTDEAAAFLTVLPHTYYEESNLHGFLISYIKDRERLIGALKDFLPTVDNWATCDLLRPKAIAKSPEYFLPFIYEMLRSERTYEARFGIEMLMTHFLDGRYDERFSSDIAAVRSEEYYINMMKAWYFATALAKQYDSAVKFIENGALDVWSHNKAIQKACESFRVSPERKAYLRTLKIK